MVKPSLRLWKVIVETGGAALRPADRGDESKLNHPPVVTVLGP
jgi:hypothetical protein